MRLAVFTSRYPAQVATFFERDMRALLEAGVAIDVFSIAPLDATLWKHSLDLLGPDRLPRHRVHHLTVADSARALADVAAKSPTARGDARAILASALTIGAVPFAKTAYVLPKAWTWATQNASRDYDHVLAYWGNYAGTCAYAFHRLATPQVPFSIWMHAGTDLYRRQAFLREKLLYADNIITCCEFNVGYMARTFGDIAARIAPKVFVCHHGLDLASFVYRPDGRPADRVIAVGRLSREKGYDYLVRAVQQLAARGTPVVVEFVGDGPEKADLAALARELGVADRIHFRGWLPFADVRRAMSEATVLVHPSNGLGDGLPNVLREAMAVGTPVIASDVAGIPDALRDGCGVLVPPRDVDALASAIARVLGDPAERLAIAANARRRAEAHYDLWRNGARLASLLESTRRSTTAPAPRVATTVRPKDSHDLVALRLLAGAMPPPDPDELDCSELRQTAERGGAIVRIADALRQPGEPFPPRFAEAAARGCRRAQQVTGLVDQLSDACTRLGLAHAFVRTVESYPDAPPSIDLLIGAPSTDEVDREITRDLHATRQHGSFHHRLGGVSTYRVAAGYRLLIRHGRLGRMGEHARLARLLLARARPASMGTAAPLAPTPEDHVLLLAMHQLYTRPDFRLSDIYTAIVALRGPVNWDYLFATALASAAIPTVACYLQYIDRAHRAVSDRPLVADDVQRRFAPPQSAPDASLQSLRFPRTWPAARLYFQNLRATLESGRWHSAARLSLVPLMAALTASHRRPA